MLCGKRDEEHEREEPMDEDPIHDAEFDIPFLPPLSPRCVVVSRRYILELALKTLGLAIENIKLSDAGEGEMYASISFDLSANRNNPVPNPKEIHGDYAKSSEDSIESASSAALDFLKNSSMIYVDDANFSELKACQKKLLAASSWAMVFECHSSNLKNKLDALTKQIEKDKNTGDGSKDISDVKDICILPEYTPFSSTADKVEETS